MCEWDQDLRGDRGVGQNFKDKAVMSRKLRI